MDLQTLLGSLVSSAVVAATISAFVSLRTTARNINVEHVTRERAKWRDKVRDKALQVHQAIALDNASRLAELHMEFSLIVNPFDAEDRQILSLIQPVADATTKQSALAQFEDRVALLLKHDWDRAKLEAAPAHRRICMRAQRVTYAELLRQRAT